MIDIGQFRALVLAPTLRHLAKCEARLDSPDAHEIVLGTILHESDSFRFLRQRPNGPARGFGQMEPATHTWMRQWIGRRPEWRECFDALIGSWVNPVEQLYTSLPYMVAATRWRFWVAPEPLPERADVLDMARYWDRFYQTVEDEHEPKAWARRYRRDALPTLPAI